MGHSRRADIVMLDDNFDVHSTWLGGKLVVKDKKITCLYWTKNYPIKDINTPLRLIKQLNYLIKLILYLKYLIKINFKINVIKTELPGIMTFQEKIQINEKLNSWNDILKTHNLCHVCVIERHNKNGEFAHGFIKNFNLKEGAVASSVGHDAHNVIVAGLNEKDMKFATNIIRSNIKGELLL